MKQKDNFSLSERCRQAIRPDRCLDAEIFCAIGQDAQASRVTIGGRPLRARPEGSQGMVRAQGDGIGWSLESPQYTSSIDAVMTLMPAGYAWMLGCSPGRSYFATLTTTDEAERSGAKSVDAENITGDSPALALLAAILWVIGSARS
jgi:hypothetical protein